MKTNALLRHLILGLTVGACICGSSAQAIAADKPTKASDTGAASGVDHQSKGQFSLIEAAPELYFAAKRQSKFFGDPNTSHGEILERSYLFGNLGGVRDDLINNGIFIDAGLTQFVQGNVSGGARTSSRARYSGSADLWLWFDTGKSDLWPGGALFLHGEGRWNRRINDDVGSLQGANFDTAMPDSDPSNSNWALSEWYLMQSLPADLLAAAGKIDMAAWADTNTFANNERSQFAYSGLVSSPIAGVFFPYTSLGGWLNWTPSKAHSLTGVYAANQTDATEAGFNKLDDGDNSFAFQYVFATEIANRPSRFLFAGLYSTTDVTSFAISEHHAIEEETGDVPIEEESENYGLLGNFSHYLWVKDGTTRHGVPPVGFGIFGRAGWSPDDRNVIDQFYNFGVGGYGMLIPGRDNDQWGIGWAGTHISDDLRDLDSNLRTWEHAGEVFYNFQLTPAAHLSLNSQVIRPASKSVDSAFTLGARLQLDF